MRTNACLGLVVLALSLHVGGDLATAQTGWMQPGVRLWYVGGVGDSDMSSNAEEAYLIESVAGVMATVKHHSAVTHWTAPRLVETGSYSLSDMGPCWMHPQRLRTIQEGDHWRGDQRITLVQHLTYTYATFPYRLLPVKALFDLAPQREFVKLTCTIDPRYATTGNAWFDAETGVLLYHHALWGGTKMFFILAEINYDFERRVAFPEDRWPHTGFRSFVRESSQGNPFMTGGGSVVIQSLVESRYGQTVQMLVLPSIVPSGFGTAYREFASFGAVPIVRQMAYPQSGDLPPDQRTPFGQHLWWWWLPPAATPRPAIDVFDVPMAKDAGQPLTYTATQTPLRFHFTMLKFDADGYMVEFAARDPTTGLHVRPGDFNYWNCKGMVPPGDPLAACVDGRDYFRDSMALPPQSPPPYRRSSPPRGRPPAEGPSP